MRLLLLYGVNCTNKIWESIKPYFVHDEIDYVEYPHEITLKAATVDDITKWVYDNYSGNSYDAVVGHSLGGIIALQLASEYKMKFDKIIYLDTNLRPAEEFYRNLMTPEHMKEYGNAVFKMMEEEKPFYRPELLRSIQQDFDYTEYLHGISQEVYALYGDRGMPDYPHRIRDLNLSDDTLNRLRLKFISNSCHMIMIENPLELSNVIQEILKDQ